MAVYTDISATELTAFLAEYEIGELYSYKGIAEGVENSNYLIHTSDGSYFLTLYEKRVRREDLPFFLGLMEHLAGRGVRCPLPVHRRDGTVIAELAGRPAAIVTYLEGMSPRRPTAEHCRAVGAALAAMHLAGRDFGLGRPNSLALADWRPLWERSRQRADELDPGLAGEVEADLDRLEKDWPADLPAGVIHADLFPDNVLFLAGEPGLIDFYFACTDFLAYDLAVCLNAWCFEKDNSFNLTRGTALLRGYSSVRALTPGEVDALPVLARGAALRFLLTRLYDWANTPEGGLVVRKDPMEYVRRQRFHRSVERASDYGLLAHGAEV